MSTGCSGGLGHGELLPNGLGSGAGHGGRGGDAYFDGTYIRGGSSYGNVELPCELGSGSGNASLSGVTSGGGIIGKFQIRTFRMVFRFYASKVVHSWFNYLLVVITI